MKTYSLIGIVSLMVACGGESMTTPAPMVEEEADSGKVPTVYQFNSHAIAEAQCWQCVPGGSFQNVCTGAVAPDAEACAYCGNHVLKYYCDVDPAKQHNYHMCDCTGCYEKECGENTPANVCQDTLCIVK